MMNHIYISHPDVLFLFGGEGSKGQRVTHSAVKVNCLPSLRSLAMSFLDFSAAFFADSSSRRTLASCVARAFVRARVRAFIRFCARVLVVVKRCPHCLLVLPLKLVRCSSSLQNLPVVT